MLQACPPCMYSVFESATFKELFKEPYIYHLNNCLYPLHPALTIGCKIRQLRLSLGLSQFKFGKSINKALTTIANYENEHRIPPNTILDTIISIYNLDKNYFK